MSRSTLLALALIVALGLAAFWVLSTPRPLTAADIPQHTPNLANGEVLYHAGGCISCHQPSPDLAGVDSTVPAGGAPLHTPIGTLYPLNLTPDPETGIGKWTDLQFLNAVMRGISPEGENLIPALPYTSYAHMKPEDVLDIRAYLASLPPVKSPAYHLKIEESLSSPPSKRSPLSVSARNFRVWSASWSSRSLPR